MTDKQIADWAENKAIAIAGQKEGPYAALVFSCISLGLVKGLQIAKARSAKEQSAKEEISLTE